MYNGPSQPHPHPQPQYPGSQLPGQIPPGAPNGPPTPRRGGTGRTVAITVAATLGAYVLVAGGIWAVTSSSGGSTSGPEFDGLPTQPCGVATGSQLSSVGAVLASASFSETTSSCWWDAEFSDGTHGLLNVSFRFATDDGDTPLRSESEAEQAFEEESDQLLNGDDGDYWSVDVQESRTLDLGDESVVSHYLEGSDDKGSHARVLVRVGEFLVEVSARENWADRTGRADFTPDEEPLIGIAERAVAHLG